MGCKDWVIQRNSSILWPPAAAISIARFTLSWPLTSAKFDEILELVGFSLFAGGHHADGDRQVEARSLFFHVGPGPG